MGSDSQVRGGSWEGAVVVARGIRACFGAKADEVLRTGARWTSLKAQPCRGWTELALDGVVGVSVAASLHVLLLSRRATLALDHSMAWLN